MFRVIIKKLHVFSQVKRVRNHSKSVEYLALHKRESVYEIEKVVESSALFFRPLHKQPLALVKCQNWEKVVGIQAPTVTQKYKQNIFLLFFKFVNIYFVFVHLYLVEFAHRFRAKQTVGAIFLTFSSFRS